MKVWLDVLTPKQVLFFQPLAETLSNRGHEVLCTSRHYREVQPLAELIGFDLKYVGEHGGGTRFGKLVASTARIRVLAEMTVDKGFDCAVSLASPDAARVAFGLAIPHICINDSPNAESTARLTVPLSHTLLTPWIIPYSDWTCLGIPRSRIKKYRALDPAAWLKRRRKTRKTLDVKLDPNRRTILVRPEETLASYLLESAKNHWAIVIDALIRSFADSNIVVLCRYQTQIEQMVKRYGARVFTPRSVVSGTDLILSSDVFIGMGGTMTTEAALLGVPAISAYPGGDLYSERLLAKQGLLTKPKTVNGIIETVSHHLQDGSARKHLEKKAKALLDWMEDPIRTIASVIEQTASTAARKH